jgi:hypothetical protein
MTLTLHTVWGHFFVAVAAAATVVLLLWSWHPPVGVYIAALALLTVLRGERIGPKDKSIWTGAMLCLVLLEINSIYKDRKEHDKEQADARKEQLTGFKEIASGIEQGLKQNQNHFDQTMSRLDTALDRVGDSIKTQTGGDSFAFITFTAEPAQAFEMHWNNFSAPRGEPYFLVSVTSHGKYPLHGTQAVMMDDERRLAAMEEYNKQPNGDWIKAINSADSEYQMPYLRPQSTEAPQGEVDVIGLYPMPQGDSKRLTINFSAPNGYWNEVLHLGRVNGNWRQCLSVLGPTAKQAKHPFIYCDSDWPEGKKLAEKDWVFTPPKKQ